MSKAILFNFDVDKEHNKIKIERLFNAPRNLVWAAWTQAEILDQWWAPKPWVAKTKSMEFKAGGHWLYAMIGPENETHWGKVDYTSIDEEETFTAYDGFCDEDGKLNQEMPRNRWNTVFSDRGDTTLVYIILSFDSLEDLEAIIKMGFKEGFTAGLENLDEYFSANSQG